MKKHRLMKHALTVIGAFIAVGLFAQNEITLDPKDMEPHQDGYYIAGIWKDKDENGEDENYNGCEDEYSDGSHNESGEQFGFTYNNSMIMPTCWPKDADEDHSLAEIDHAEGYIQLTKSRYPGTDSAHLGYIITPPLENLESLTIETSVDVSATDSRHIYFWLEYSKNNGASWEPTYLQDESFSKKGDVRTYDGSVYFEFDEMKTASTEGPIVIRIMSAPQQQPQRLKIHYIKIVADEGVVPVNEIGYKRPSLSVVDDVIHAGEGHIEVYSILGRFIGQGSSVAVKQGVYIVRTSQGDVHKMLVK